MPCTDECCIKYSMKGDIQVYGAKFSSIQDILLLLPLQELLMTTSLLLFAAARMLSATAIAVGWCIPVDCLAAVG
jgi:hypothetical protein